MRWLFYLTMFECLDSLKSSAKQQSEPMKKNPSAAKPLPAELIRELLEIDETVPSGLRWKTRPLHHFKHQQAWKMWNTRYAGKHAGKRKAERIYWAVKIGGALYLTHRIIYLLAHGVDPGSKHIDHIRADLLLPNVVSNLRLATNAENGWNRGRQRNNTSGAAGVYWDKQSNKWQSQIKINGRGKHLGLFVTFDDAITARKAAEARYFGEFSYDASRTAVAHRHLPSICKPYFSASSGLCL